MCAKSKDVGKDIRILMELNIMLDMVIKGKRGRHKLIIIIRLITCNNGLHRICV